MRIDGLEDYTLGKDYGPYKADDVIAVDPDRRKWLDENGFSATLRQEVAEIKERLESIPHPPSPLSRHKRTELTTPRTLTDIPTPLQED